MRWNEYLADALNHLFLVVPAFLVTLKLAYPKIPTKVIWGVAGILSWIVGNASLRAFPPENGFANAVMLLIGWVYMLVPLGIFFLIYLPLRRWSGSRVFLVLAIGLLIFAVSLPLSACFRWIPESDARNVAIKELQQRGDFEGVIHHVKRTRDGWTLYVKGGNHKLFTVHLSRSGFCTGFGG